MRRVTVLMLFPLCAGTLVFGGSARSSGIGTGDVDPRPFSSILYKSTPFVLRVSDLASNYDGATATDIEIADLNNDGRNDIAVAWYANDNEDRYANIRALSIFFNEGGGFSAATDIDLYIPDPDAWMSVFKNGTSDIGVGDFDADGDADLAVTAFFGDELWLIENLGGGQFAQHLKFPFGANTPTIFQSPPEVVAGDFDGDTRQELAYIVDPIQYVSAQKIHFWKTADTIANMYRVEWEGDDAAVFTQWTRGLAVADFNGDGRDDLCFSGSVNPPYEDDPVFTVWYDLNVGTQRFAVHNEYPDILCSDVIDVVTPGLHQGVLLTDLDGTTAEYWQRSGSGVPDFVMVGSPIAGYAGLGDNRGMAGVAVDVDGDGDLDLVTKQKLGEVTDADQIELTVYAEGGKGWMRMNPTPLDSSGFHNDPNNGIMRPHNLAAGDLMGTARPEIAAGFAASDPDGGGNRRLEIAVWENGCVGDIDSSGVTDDADLVALMASFGLCEGQPGFDADADIDKDGCITASDSSLLRGDLGCRCRGACAGQVIGDANCDGVFDNFDMDAFTLAATYGQAAWEQSYGGEGCDYLCVNDVNGDGVVDNFDVSRFIELLVAMAG